MQQALKFSLRLLLYKLRVVNHLQVGQEGGNSGRADRAGGGAGVNPRFHMLVPKARLRRSKNRMFG